MTNSEYQKEYYDKNKSRIAKRNKELYLIRKNDPILNEKRKKKATEASRRWREKHPEKVRESRKRLYDNRKIRALEMLGGAYCVNCGCDELSFLEINHINGNGCKEHKENGNRIIDGILAGTRKTDDLNVLCRVCNALDHLGRKDKIKSSNYKIIYTGNKAVKL